MQLSPRKLPLLIIITGHPGTGKTGIGRVLSNELHIPLISKDEIKNRIFDTLGHSDKVWSLKVSSSAHRIMDYIIEEELTNGQSLIIESNFKTEIDSKRFNELKSKYSCNLVQLLIYADGELVFKRFMERMHSPDRHEGHVESTSVEEIRQGFLVPYPPLEVDGKTIGIDTTDFSAVNIKQLLRALSS